MSTEQLRIPKQLVRVEIRDTNGEVGPASVFLAEATAAGGRPERLQDLLHERRFVPIRDGDAFSFVSRDHVTWLRLDLIAAIDELDPEAEGSAASVSAGVRIVLEDGSVLLGGIRYLRPKTSRRVGDYLEGLPSFFPLRTPDFLYLINRDRVVRVSPIEEVSG